MEKGKVTSKHLILFGVAILALGLTAGPYVMAIITNHDEPLGGSGARRGPGGGPGGGPGRFDPERAKARAAQMLERMSTQLSLTETQKTQIKAIQDSTAPQRKAIFDNTSLSQEQRREEMRKIRTESQTRIKQVLTPEQQTKYDAMIAEMRSRMGGGMGGPGGGGYPGAAGGYPGARGGYPGGMGRART